MSTIFRFHFFKFHIFRFQFFRFQFFRFQFFTFQLFLDFNCSHNFEHRYKEMFQSHSLSFLVKLNLTAKISFHVFHVFSLQNVSWLPNCIFISKMYFYFLNVFLFPKCIHFQNVFLFPKYLLTSKLYFDFQNVLSFSKCIFTHLHPLWESKVNHFDIAMVVWKLNLTKRTQLGTLTF